MITFDIAEYKKTYIDPTYNPNYNYINYIRIYTNSTSYSVDYFRTDYIPLIFVLHFFYRNILLDLNIIAELKNKTEKEMVLFLIDKIEDMDEYSYTRIDKCNWDRPQAKETLSINELNSLNSVYWANNSNAFCGFHSIVYESQFAGLLVQKSEIKRILVEILLGELQDFTGICMFLGTPYNYTRQVFFRQAIRSHFNKIAKLYEIPIFDEKTLPKQKITLNEILSED